MILVRDDNSSPFRVPGIFLFKLLLYGLGLSLAFDTLFPQHRKNTVSSHVLKSINKAIILSYWLSLLSVVALKDSSRTTNDQVNHNQYLPFSSAEPHRVCNLQACQIVQVYSQE